MTVGRAVLALVAGLAAAASADAQVGDVAAADAAARARVTQAIVASGFAGTYAVSAGPRTIAAGSVGLAVPDRPAAFTYEQLWPWASVTKQVVATLVMQEVDAGRIALDAPAARYLPSIGSGGPTVRQLLQHRSGLANPDDTPVAANAMPAYYTASGDPLRYCLTRRGAAGGQWRYNNCDYVVLGALLERTTRTAMPQLFAQRIAAPLGMTAHFAGNPVDTRADAQWAGGPTAAERQVLARYGAAGGLVGTAGDLIAFDRALLSGLLLTDAARRTMWQGDAALGGMALGQWSFQASIKGCAAPVRIVERRGAIGRFAVRNILLPDRGWSIALFTNRGDPEGAKGFGEIWQGQGISYAVVAAAACA